MSVLIGSPTWAQPAGDCVIWMWSMGWRRWLRRRVRLRGLYIHSSAEALPHCSARIFCRKLFVFTVSSLVFSMKTCDSIKIKGLLFRNNCFYSVMERDKKAGRPPTHQDSFSASTLSAVCLCLSDIEQPPPEITFIFSIKSVEIRHKSH